MKFNAIKCKGIHMGRSIHNCTCIVMDSKWAATQKMKFWSCRGLFSRDISPVLSFGCKDTSAYLALLEKNETENLIMSLLNWEFFMHFLLCFLRKNIAELGSFTF